MEESKLVHIKLQYLAWNIGYGLDVNHEEPAPYAPAPKYPSRA